MFFISTDPTDYQYECWKDCSAKCGDFITTNPVDGIDRNEYPEWDKELQFPCCSERCVQIVNDEYSHDYIEEV